MKGLARRWGARKDGVTAGCRADDKLLSWHRDMLDTFKRSLRAYVYVLFDGDKPRLGEERDHPGRHATIQAAKRA